MRLPEQKLYDWFRRKVGHLMMLERIENRVKTNTPDLYACHSALSCWIEFKYLVKFPAKPTTKVNLTHWTSGQRFWAMRHRQNGGTTLLVLQVGDELFVAEGGVIALESDHWTEADWRKLGSLSMRNATSGQVLDALLNAVV